jgi:hypothetical protein
MPTIINPNTTDGTNNANCGTPLKIASEVADAEGPKLMFPPPTTLAVALLVPLAAATVSRAE